MSLFISSLNSGSNGNCYYVGNSKDAVLVDVGISCREIEKRMKRSGLQIKNIRAVFISHEHSDHVRGLSTFAQKYKIPVYISEQTLQHCRFGLDAEQVKFFKHGDVISVADIKISCFLKRHDAADPHSFLLEHNDIRVGVFTDIGSVCSSLVDHFRQCHAAFLESNYDEKMLDTGNYPYVLKKRIKSDHGHLSNFQALELFNNSRSSYLSHLILSHLSKENNAPVIVKELFEKHKGSTKIIVASREKESEVFHVNGTFVKEKLTVKSVQAQMSLF